MKVDFPRFNGQSEKFFLDILFRNEVMQMFPSQKREGNCLIHIEIC